MIDKTNLGVFQPSLEIVATLTQRLHSMDPVQLEALDDLIGPDAMLALLVLLPELEQITDNVSRVGIPKANNKVSGRKYTSDKALAWWQQNDWFNTKGFERETAAARAIDVLIDLEGYDKTSEEYFEILNLRLQKAFPNQRRIKVNNNGIKSKVLRLH